MLVKEEEAERKVESAEKLEEVAKFIYFTLLLFSLFYIRKKD